MKKLWTIIFLSAAFVSHAQPSTLFYFDQRYDFGRDKLFKELYQHGELKGFTTLVSVFHDGNYKEKILNSESAFDSSGNVVNTTYYNKDGKVKYTWRTEHDQVWNTTRVQKLGRHGQQLSDMQSTYDTQERLTERKFYTRDKLKNTQAYVWNDQGKMIESDYFWKGKPVGKYVYSYYDNGDRKEIIAYNKKGRIERRWSYDCNPLGKEVKKKDSFRVCEKTEFDKNGDRAASR